MLRREILPEVRRLVGERRITLVFDREGGVLSFSRRPISKGSTSSRLAKANSRHGP
jgi:hypothetical protein